MPPGPTLVLRPGDAFKAVSDFLNRHAPRDRSRLALPPPLGDRPRPERGPDDFPNRRRFEKPIGPRSGRRQRRLGELLGGELLGSVSIASAVTNGAGGAGGGGGLTGGVDGSQYLGLDLVEEASDGFDNSIIEPLWSPWHGSWAESGGSLAVSALGGGTITAAIMATHAVLGDHESEAVIDGTTGNLFFGHATLSGSDILGYALRIEAGMAQIIRFDPAVVPLNTTFPLGIVAGDTFALRIEGGTLTGKRNGSTLLTATDSTYTSGYVGLGQIGAVGLNSYASWSVAPV